MKICVIGSGFFGLHVASQLKKKVRNCSLDVFESKSSPFTGAAFNNQCRLHLGFHYPRSGYTIYQSVLGFDRFRSEYPVVCNPIASNFYAIHKDGYVSAENYFAVMDSFHLDYSEQKIPSFFKKKSDIEAVIKVPEQWINLKSLRHQLLSFVSENIKCDSTVSEVCPNSGKVFVNGRLYDEYDLVINATYTNPNIGATKPFYELKYELAALVNCETSFNKDTAVTVMDGPFVSIYPSSTNTHTLSSVLYTPHVNCNSVSELSAYVRKGLDISAKASVSDKIINHVSEFIDLKIGKQSMWLSTKVKLASDYGDSRVTQVKREGKLVSVLCGKLDAVFEASDSIMQGLNYDL